VLQWLGAREGATVEGLQANLEEAGLSLEARHDFPEHEAVLLVMLRSGAPLERGP
jgi:hypothetical protein